jgi:hypothetical protein
MEIVFKAPTQPQSLLNLDDSLAQRPGDTLWALLYAIRDATFNTDLKEERPLLLDCFKALQVESLFRSVSKTLTYDWVPTPREQRIIQAACHGYYPDSQGDIEGAFSKHGGLYGIIALVIVFRYTDSILRPWNAIKIDAARRWLVTNVVQLFTCQKNQWIDHFTLQGTPSL